MTRGTCIGMATALLITVSGRQQAWQVDPHAAARNGREGTMNALDHTIRYREYLRTFGIAEAGDRVAEFRDLDLGDVRFFAYADSDGMRLKAAVTTDGLVTRGGRADDDWYGFLSRMPNAPAAAVRIAWLETDASTAKHGLPRSPTSVLTPDRPPAPGIDPAQWALVTSPVLLAGSGDSVKLIAWFLAGGTSVPTRWTVTARRGADAVIERTPALDLLTMHAGSADAAAADAAGRARQILATGTDDERRWALQYISDTGDRAFVPDITALLADTRVGPDARLHAAGTLARLADPAAVAALAVALRSDTAPEVRRAIAQALGRIGGAGAVQALTEAASNEPNVGVRVEIVHALAAQGSVARAALVRIAHSDPDADVLKLARISVDALK